MAPPGSVCVDRCVCFARPLSDLLTIARKAGATTLEALQEETEFGLACRLCNPYVRRMLRTGETSFEVMPDDEDIDLLDEEDPLLRVRKEPRP